MTKPKLTKRGAKQVKEQKPRARHFVGTAITCFCVTNFGVSIADSTVESSCHGCNSQLTTFFHAVLAAATKMKTL